MSKQSRIRGINHILSLNRTKNSKHLELANPYYDTDSNGNNVQVCCDGYRLAVLRDFADVKQFLTVHSTSKTFPNWKIFVDVDTVEQKGTPVVLPDLKQLKEYTKSLDNMNLKAPYDFGENSACINCHFLIDAMEIIDLKTAKAYSFGYHNTCLLIIDANGNYVYTMGVDKQTKRALTDLSIRYDEIMENTY